MKKPAPGELQPFCGLMLGIYQLGVSLTWINPASPGWPKGGKADACRAIQIANVQGSRRTVQGRQQTEAHQATEPKMEGGNQSRLQLGLCLLAGQVLTL